MNQATAQSGHSPPSSDPDLILGRKAVDAGYVREDQVRTCLRERDADVAAGRTRRFLGKILVEHGLISFVQLVELLKAEEAPPRAPGVGESPAVIAPPPLEPTMMLAAPEMLNPVAPPEPTIILAAPDAPVAGPAPEPTIILAAPDAPIPAPPHEPTVILAGPELPERAATTDPTIILAAPDAPPLDPTLVLAPAPNAGSILAPDPAHQLSTLLLDAPVLSSSSAPVSPPRSLCDLGSEDLSRPIEFQLQTLFVPSAPRPPIADPPPVPVPAAPPPMPPNDAATLIQPASVPEPIELLTPAEAPPPRLAASPAHPVAPSPPRPPAPSPPPSAKASSGFRVLISKKQGGGQAHSTFGRYQLMSELARGAMGIVYRAFDPELKRTVALKVMLPGEGITPEAKSRFQREALLAARLHHPNIVQVYDVGEAEGKPFYTMHLVDGSSLQQILNTMGRLPQQVALTIVRDAARALHHAHEHKMVHRDIKPANLLLTTVRDKTVVRKKNAGDTTLEIRGVRTSSFRVLVSDFGIAKDVTSQTFLTREGTVLGTPAYMSPEQARGEQDRLTPVSDVYSLGVLLYQLLCGQTPFTNPDPVKVLADILQKDPPPLRKLAPDVHPDLETIVQKAMERDAKRRYPSAEEFADDIDRFLVGDTIRAQRRSWLYRTWRATVRHPAAAASIGIVMITVAYAAIAFGVWPEVRRVLDARAAEERRTIRAGEARAHLARAEGLLQSGAREAAVTEARALLVEYAHEDLPLAGAHALLARAYAQQGAVRDSLRERFLALRAALGREEEDQAALEVARELVRRARHDDAALLLARLAWHAHTPSARAEARYWLGRATEGGMAFGAAAGSFAGALSGGALPATLIASCAEHRDFCRACANEIPLPIRTTVPVLLSADFAGDGKAELVGVRGRHLFAGRLRDGVFVESAHFDVTDGEKEEVRFLGIVAAAGSGRPLLAAASDDRIHLLRRDGGGLRELASASVEGPVGGIVAADLDGDGRAEIVVVDRSLQVFRWDEAGAALTGIRLLTLGGEAAAVEAFDADGDGRSELAVFSREGLSPGITVFRADAAGFVPLQHASVGAPITVERVERTGGAPRFLIGTGWDERTVDFRRQALGSPRFEELTPPPGVYLLDPQSDGTCKRTALCALDWKSVAQGMARAARLRIGAVDFWWCALTDRGPADAGEAGGTFHVFRSSEPDVPFAVLTPASARSRLAPGDPLMAVDVDGDGRPEPVFQDRDEWFCLREADLPEPFSGPDSASSVPAAIQDPLLDFAGDVERAGFFEEAGAAFRDAALADRSLRVREEAVCGQLRCLARLDHFPRMVALAQEAARAIPPLAAPILREALRLLEAARLWPEAARLAEASRADAGLDREAREMRALADLHRRCRLIGPDAVALDWLASSPLAAARHEDGTWTVWAGSKARDKVVACLAGATPAWRLTGSVEIRRQDAGVTLRLGAGGSDGAERVLPALALVADREGDRVRNAVRLETAARNVTLLAMPKAWTEALPVDLSWFARRGTCLARLPVGRDRPAPAEAELLVPGAGPLSRPGWECGGEGTLDLWGVFHIELLEFQAAGEEVRPAAFEPVTAVEHLEFAAGRWIQGRLADAMELYGRGVRLADLERAKEEGARAAGLPTAWDRLSAADPARWASVDGRFYRALLLAARSDTKGAQEGLGEAWTLSPDRVRTLLRRYALPLLDRPGEAAALRAFWGSPAVDRHGAEPRAWALETFAALGPEAAELLIEGAAIDEETHPGIGAVMLGGPAARCGLLPADVLLRVDDAPVGSAEDLRAAIQAAARAGRDQVVIDVSRHGREQKVRAPAQDLGLELFQARTRTLRGS